MTSSEAARRKLQRFEAFCDRFLELRLEPFQRLILIEVFAGRRELLVLIPRGNGKTTLFAAIALYHLLSTPKPRVYIGASSRQQAGLLFEEMKRFVLAHAALRRRVVLQKQQIDLADGTGFAKVMSSDGFRAHGLMPTLCLVDELHAHPNDNLYVAFKTALGKRPEAQLVTISTAGHDDERALGRMRQKALELDDVAKDGTLTVARSPTGKFCMLEWALDPEADFSDPEVLKTANPASFVTLEFLAEQIESPGLDPAELACFHGNIWPTAVLGWLRGNAWGKLTVPGLEIPDRSEVWLGVDVGLRKDTAAVVTLAHLSSIERWAAQAKIFDPPSDGGEIDLAELEDEIRSQAGRYTVAGVVFDPWQFIRSAQLLGDEGLLMIEHPMSNERTSPATSILRDAINTGQLAHDGDRRFAAHVNAGVTTLTERGARLTKRLAKKPIDALMALLIGYAIASEQGGTSVYEERGLLVF